MQRRRPELLAGGSPWSRAVAPAAAYTPEPVLRSKGTRSARVLFRDEDDASSPDSGSRKGNTAVLGVLFAASIALIYATFANFPALSTEEYAKLKFPYRFEDLRDLYSVLQQYQDKNFAAVLSGFCLAYMFLQTFAIPGAIFLSVLAGPLFGVWTGLLIVSMVATTGATMCYLMSYYLGRGLVERFFPQLLHRFRDMVEAQKDNLPFYLLFLRISPLIPNWFINVSSPILNVPLKWFVLMTLIGLVPANFIHVNTGLQLQNLSGKGGLSIYSWLFLFALAFLALLPTLCRKRFEEWDRKMRSSHKTA